MERNYTDTLKHIEGLISGEPDFIANLSNIAAVLKTLPGVFWVGFYIVKGNELVLGPFQGPVACTRIGYNKGVCGTAWAKKETILVPDVHEFPGHIACNENSKSEVVVPVFGSDGNVNMVLDVDSDILDAFDQNDAEAFEKISAMISKLQYQEA